MFFESFTSMTSPSNFSNFSNAFGSLESIDASDMTDVKSSTNEPTSLSIDEFKNMAMNLAKTMKPDHLQNLRSQINTMPIEISTVTMMLNMNQFAPLKMMLKNKDSDPNFENAVQTILSWSNTAQPNAQVQALQLVLSLPVPEYHANAKQLLDEARLATKKQKSTKSIRNRLRKERLRRKRMMKKKKK